MKEQNIVKHFDNGWIVGLTSRNDVVVESPNKNTFFPYLHPNGSDLIDGTWDNNEGRRTEEMPMAVKLFVKDLLERRKRLRNETYAEREIFEDEEDLDDSLNYPPTMEDLGFGDGVAKLDCSGDEI